MPDAVVEREDQRGIDRSVRFRKIRRQRRGGYVRRIILGHHRDGIVGESHDPVGKQSLGRYVVETGAGYIRDDLRTSTRAEGQPGIERGFDDVRGDGRDATVRGIGIEVDRRCYRYAVHQARAQARDWSQSDP